jgi:hypothetical protein
MQWEQLSFLNPSCLHQAQPFDPGSNFESDPISESVDSSFPHNRTQSIINIEQPGERQQVLERLLEKICPSTTCGTRGFAPTGTGCSDEHSMSPFSQPLPVSAYVMGGDNHEKVVI